MKINLKSTNMELTPAIHEYVVKRVTNLGKLLKNIEKRLNKIDKMIQKQIKQKTQNNKQEDTKYTILHEDCFLALIGLGMSKKEATFVVNSTFNKYKIKTVQEFIYLALGKK